ncbi:PrsW family glutamic-type intramembrane protease [Actinocrispum wychmicini]|uniref:Protease prsW family protein n=1 Tax=Actinocrispum wychmicini TaxID=1213861 RepID=A0A4R2JX80_9PSEU|nr:PrsW family glutamic-type intramembrane protease [Actinocrispum wychmicini]TCO61998.1 protease prsW family protein [Actinocrispum wychmicini]
MTPPAQAYHPWQRRPGSRDNRMRTVLLIAVTLSAVYAVQIVIDMCRPRYPEELAHAWVGWLNPWLRFAGPEPAVLWYQVSFWCYLVSLPAALAIWLASRRTAGDPRKWQALAAGVLLLPYPVWVLDTVFGHFLLILLCLPSTAYALWLVHRMQRYGRMPVRLLVSVAGAGVLVGGGFGGSMQQWWQDYGSNFLTAQTISSVGEQNSPQEILLHMAQLKPEITAGGVLFAGVFEEVGKAAGIAIVYLLLRRHVHNVVSGIVLGAASGIGFNLSEAAAYMAQSPATDSTQYFLRQSLGLLAAHMAFTAAIGAGFGIARQMPDRRSRWLAISSGFAVGIGGHIANDVFITTWSLNETKWFSPSPIVHTLVLTPLAFLLFQGPMVLLYLVLLRRGLRDQAAGLAVELADEAELGFGAVTPDEVPVLLRPMRRFYLQLKALRHAGPTSYLRLGRLYDAQLQLGLARWHRSRGEQDPFAPDVRILRDRVVGLKKQQFAAARFVQPLQGAS